MDRSYAVMNRGICYEPRVWGPVVKANKCMFAMLSIAPIEGSFLGPCSTPGHAHALGDVRVHPNVPGVTSRFLLIRASWNPGQSDGDAPARFLRFGRGSGS